MIRGIRDSLFWVTGTYICIFIVGLSTYGHTQRPYTPTVVNPIDQSWRWIDFPHVEDLGVTSVFESSNRHLWLSVSDGVLECTHENKWVTHNSENGLNVGQVREIYETADQSILILADEGLFKYRSNGEWDLIFSPPEGLTIRFTDITELESGMLALSSGRGVFLIDENNSLRIITSLAMQERINRFFDRNVRWVTLPDLVLSDGVFTEFSCVLQDEGDQLWLALTLPKESGKLVTISPSALKKDSLEITRVIHSSREFPLGESQKLMKAEDGKIWVINSTFKHGINVIGEHSMEYIRLGYLFNTDEHMTDIAQSNDGTIWVSGLGKVFTFDNEKWEMYKAPKVPIPGNRILLENSHTDRIWILGYKSKLSFLDLSSDYWLTYSDLNYQCSSDSLGDVFIDVNGGLVIHNEGNWLRYGADDGLMNAPVRAIVTSSGQLWAAGSHDQIASTALLKDGEWSMQTHDSLSWGIDYRAVFEDQSGNLWFGAAVDADFSSGQMGGVLQLTDPDSEERTWILHPKNKNGLQQSNAYGIGQSPDGRIWIGGGQLYYYDSNRWSRLDEDQFLDYFNQVTSTDDALYAGSRYYGLYILNDKGWSHYDKSDGTGGNSVVSVAASETTGEVYLATEGGIALFDGSQWIPDVMPDEFHMDVEGGVLRFNDDDNSLWINLSSREWKRRAFPHQNVHSAKDVESNFITHRYRKDADPPETELLVFEEEVSSAGNTVIRWRGSDWFSRSSKKPLLYSWRLNGGVWSPFARDDYHAFSDLPNGNYTFEVRARDLSLNVDPSPAKVEFSVLPPIYKQTWFILLLLAFIGIVGYMEYRILRKNSMLARLNTSLKNVNTKLEDRNSKIELQNHEILNHRDKILKQSEQLKEININLEKRNIEVNLQKDQLADLVTRVEELTNLKLQFFTNIAHELRTPLSLIEGPLHQLSSTELQISEEQRTKLFEIMQRNVSRLSLLSNQLLEMRKIEDGKVEVNLTPVSISEYLSGLIMMFEDLANHQQVDLTLVEQEDDVHACIDTDKLTKIIVNLLSNAFKHTPIGGKISIDSERITESSDTLIIRVTNSGEGINKEKLDQIFNRYYSSSDGRKTQWTGFGIGLAYARDLIDTMDGNLDVKSEEGKNTRFIISLPFIVPKEKGIVSHVPGGYLSTADVSFLTEELKVNRPFMQQIHRSDKSETVLIVEDNRDMHEFLGVILKDDFNLVHAMDGEEGWNLANSEQVDIVISDVMMPGIDGLSFCKKLKSHPSTSELPVILLSAKAMDNNLISGYLTGADSYITKPFNPELLRIRIINLIEQRRRLKVKANQLTRHKPDKEEVLTADQQLLQNVLKIIEDNMGDPDFNVNQLCQMVHLSHMHFIRKIKRLTGKKPVDILKTFRLQRGKEHLEEGNLSIAETAYKVGYNLPNSFSRAFKKEFGYSPSEVNSAKSY